MTEWISLYELIPQTDFMVLGACDDDVFQCYHVSDGFFVETDMLTEINVTHWMPIPKPPEDDND